MPIGFSEISIIEGALERTSLRDGAKDRIIDLLLDCPEERLNDLRAWVWATIDMNKILSLDERYCQILNDPRQ